MTVEEQCSATVQRCKATNDESGHRSVPRKDSLRCRMENRSGLRNKLEAKMINEIGRKPYEKGCGQKREALVSHINGKAGPCRDDQVGVAEGNVGRRIGRGRCLNRKIDEGIVEYVRSLAPISDISQGP